MVFGGKIPCAIALALFLLLGFLFSSCGLFRNDRMYISERKYELANRIYDGTDSLLLTEQRLLELHWQRGEINEAIYRLKKQRRLE